jgi:integrase
MPRLTRSAPAYKLHKASGQARVRLDGRSVYLGKYGTEESRREYQRVIAEWFSAGRVAPQGRAAPSGVVTITEAVAAYWRYASDHYVRDGKPTRELDNIRDALRQVKALYGHVEVAEFGPVGYRAVRSAMIEAKLSRTTINYRLGKVRRFVRWAVEAELAPADLYHRLCAVAPLRAGREGVREREPVRPVPDEHVEAVLPRVRPPVRAMIELQRLTAMRPGEVCAMTTGAIDRTGEIWTYRPAWHKTAGIGRDRVVFIGPRAQEILRPWLRADPDVPVFSPAADHERRQAERRAGRRSPMTPSQVARARKAQPKRKPRRAYTPNSYAAAIRRVCNIVGVPIWGPNRLRHGAATAIRRAYGLEASQVILGHSKADTTQIYAERDAARAREVMRAIG